jgi:primary-amine oxidase
VLAHRPGAEVQRRVHLIALDLATGGTHEGVVSPATGELEEWVQVPTAAPPYGQAPIMLQEFELVAEIVKADPGWREAIAKRGVEDIDSVFVAPLSPGQFGHEDEAGKRILRSLSFLRDNPTDSPWAHLVEGLIAHVDIIGKQVIKLVDTGVVAVPAEQGNFDEARVGAPRTTLKPLEIVQREGPSFTVQGSEVTWQN